MLKILETLEQDSSITPKFEDIFKPLEVEMEKIKVVILDSHPYTSEATGYALETASGKVTPTLKVVFTSLLKSGLSTTLRKDGNLQDWVDQGVLLLNSSFTTKKGYSDVHLHYWTPVIVEILNKLQQSEQPVAFLLLGSTAQAHCLLTQPYMKEPKYHLYAPHPTQEIYGRLKFSDRDDFARVNQFLLDYNQTPIIWDTNLPKTTRS